MLGEKLKLFVFSQHLDKMLNRFSPILEKSSIVLASQSPRRQSILRDNLNLKFEVVVSGFPEDIDKASCHGPADYCSQTCRLKAITVKDFLISQGKYVDFIISADTIVVSKDNEILEKPIDFQGAKDMLQMLSNTNHSVITSVTIGYKPTLYSFQPLTLSSAFASNSANPHPYYFHTFYETSFVKMASIDELTIDSYIATGEPMDKSGNAF
jgi:septum formation protein